MKISTLFPILPWHVVLAAGLALGAAAPAAAGTTTTSAGDIRATLSTLEGVMPGTGLSVTYRDLPLISRSTVNIVSPDWSKSFLTLGRAKGSVTTTDLPEGRRIAFTADTDAVSLAYTVDVLSGNRVALTLESTLHVPGPAVIEYSAGYLSAVLLAGQPYRAETDAGAREGRFPLFGKGTDPKTAMLLPPLRRLEASSRLGALVVEDAEGPPLDLFDARKVSSVWLQEEPTFWLGHLAAPLETGKPFRSRVVLALTPAPATDLPARPSPPAASLPVTDVPDARIPPPPDPTILPAPKEWRRAPGAFRINARTRIEAADGHASRRAADEIAGRLREHLGLEVPVVPAAAANRWENVIVVAAAGSRTARRWERWSGLRPVTKREGYAVTVRRDYALVVGADARGALYGAFTLLQLARRESTGTVSFAAGAIRDWPVIPIRAVHLLTDDWSTFLHRDLIRDVLAPHKINTILLECEYVKWQSHPEINVPWGMSKEEVRAILAEARRYDIEVIPLVELLGHVGWMFQNGQHLDLAEDPAARYAYCPSNPATYRLVFDILGEALELFGHPRYFHIGHDEFTHRGKFAQEGPCKGKSVTELFAQDTIRLHDYLAAHRARTMMWGDMLLGPGEAADATDAPTVAEAERRRALLPKDILITDWHYQPADAYPSVGIFRRAGFDVWGATWYRPANIEGFARAAAREATGLVQTTWTGYYGNVTALRREFPQFAAYVAAACAAWAPGTPIADLQAPAAERFLSVWPAFPHSAAPAPGFTVDLSPLANAPLRDTPARDGWLGFGPDLDLSAVPGGARRLGETLFSIPENGKGIAVSGPLLGARYPDSVTVPIGRRARELHLLLTAGWEVGENRRVGVVEVRYADGTVLPVPLLYGWNIRAATDRRVAPAAPVVWEADAPAGARVRLRAFAIRNPLPRKEIAAVRLLSAGTEAAPLLLGLTGVE